MGVPKRAPPEFSDQIMPSPPTLYDNYTRTLRVFEPLKPGEVGLYTCGPTVYDYQHIGNFRTFLFEDVLKRVLEWNVYRGLHVMDISDTGHLGSDRDPGADNGNMRALPPCKIAR